ncbi:hypothetical protein M3G91_01645 [Micromonospora chalcea]|uniref:hypothetical protein n=1 Tax=Micromonospora chalcea TaxID=1874 RepID=UPI0021A60D6B|nr:hypothetical protein [Micromonospora chalcea]MCT2276312.1 hypothetical protein [Micromonospora chalcea]
MARDYTSAARRAAATPTPSGADPVGLLAWVDNHTGRARQALRDLEALPVDPRDEAAARQRQWLVDQLLDVFPSFTLDGERFRVLGEMQLLDLCELMRLNKRNVKTVDPAGVAALADFFTGCLGPDEYERFRTYCRDNCVDQDVLNDIMEGIVEDLSEVPTSRPSHSVPGPSSSGPTSRVVSLSRTSPQPGSPPPAVPLTDPQAFEEFLQRRAQQPPEPEPLGAPAAPWSPTTQDPGFVSFG